MPLINNQKSPETNNFSAQPTNFNQTQNQPLNNQLTPNQGLFQIPEKFLQLIPWIPVGLEMLTGQKIPPVGALADILSSVQSVQFSLQQVLTNQQQIYARLEALESNASSQLTNLSQQITSTNNSFKLLATETKRSLELSSQPQPRISEAPYETP